jgi:hypothetical protein
MAICKICRKEISLRPSASFHAANYNGTSTYRYPIFHMRTKFMPCHGFFVEAEVKDD